MTRALELIGAAGDLVEAAEPRLRALVPEPDRRGRLLGEAGRLASGVEPFLVGIKDIINVDGLETGAGSTLPAALFAGPEARAVTRLRTAGGLVLAKTTTTEFAFAEPAPTTNPHDHRHTPGGSSSGSVAAVAAGYVSIALGTQTVDSIVTPAAYCAVVGFKPSYGRVPVDGVLPFAPAMDHVGVLARDLDTAAFAAAVVCDDWRTGNASGATTLGLPAPTFLDAVEPEARAVFDTTVRSLEAAGWKVARTDVLADITDVAAHHRRLVAAQFASVHRRWFDEYGDRYRPRTAALVAEGRALGETAVADGLAGSSALRADLTRAMDRNHIDVWISPAATGTAPRGLDFIGDPIMGVPWTHAHLPVVALPCGAANGGLPLGIQLTGRLGADEDLLTRAGEIARALR